MKANKLRNRKSKIGFSLFLVILSFGFVLSGCYPGDALSPAETDVITSFYKDGTDFSSKLTYSIPDTVIHISGDDEINDEPGPFDDQILERIKRNLEQMGYTEAANPQSANVHVAAAVTTSTWVSGGCMPYWSYWYPWGWCVPYSYTWQTGSILIFMAEGDRQTEEDAIWFAGINGILENSTSGTSSRINNNIDQAFTQSPYLGDGK